MEQQDQQRHVRADTDVDNSNAQLLALCEIISVISTALIVAWVVLPLAGSNHFALTVSIALAFCLIIFSHYTRGETPSDLGWRIDNFGQAVGLLLPPMLLAGIIFVLIGSYHQSLHFRLIQMDQHSLLKMVGGVSWALLQQAVLQGFFNRRAQVLFGSGVRSTLLVALIFAVLHLPNPGLMLVTFFGGVVWAIVYQRVPNLFALALSHALMTWLMIATVPPAALRGLRVGYRYFTLIV